MSDPQQTLTIQQALDLAVQHQTAGHLSQAEQIYQQILQNDPNQPVALHLLGVIAHQEGKNDVAVDRITRALAIQPNYAEAHNNLGNVLQELGKTGEAVASYHKALELNPDYAEAHNNLGIALKDLGKLEDATTSYHRALDIRADYVEAHNNLGLAFQGLGRLEDAVASYGKALTIKPDFAIVHSNLGMALRKLGKLEDGVASCRKALDLKPDLAEAHNNLGSVLQALDRPDEAVASYRKALDLKPDYAEAHNNLGNALTELGKQEDAVASYRRALDLKPDLAEAHNNLGNALKGLGKPEEAMASYRKALAIKPDYAEAHYHLGLALEDLGLGSKLDEAAASYHKALELHPSDLNARVSLANITDRLVPSWHIPMMNDHLRNDAYLAALQTAVTADTHVLEIGTGSGLLAMIAARYRAEQVTTCEASPLIAATAKEIISTNGMADTINVIAKKSTNLEVGVDLPCPADLLVFEIFSSEFLAEGVLSSVEDAKRRLLSPEGRIIPSAGSVMIALFGGNHVGQNFMVKDVSGFDVSKFNSITSKRRFFKANHFDIKLLTDDVEAFSFDFNEDDYFPAEQKTLKIPVTTAAECHGIIQWNRMRMDDTIIFENHPSVKSRASAWSHVAYVFDEPISVQPHQTAIVSAMHNRVLPWFTLENVEECQ